jgi:GNAT superfamily N-acetyltransferase
MMKEKLTKFSHINVGHISNLADILLRKIAKRKQKHQYLRIRMIFLFTHEEDLNMPTLSNSYKVQWYMKGGETAWVDLLNDGKEFGDWNLYRLRSEILSTLIPGSGVFILHNSRFIGCSALCDIPEMAPYATLMYIKVHKDYRRKGLGSALIAQCLQRAEEMGFPGVVLNTESYRIPAINTYLKIGFQPDFKSNPNTEEWWKSFSKSGRMHQLRSKST